MSEIEFKLVEFNPETAAEAPPVKRKAGRPKGSKNLHTNQSVKQPVKPSSEESAFKRAEDKYKRRIEELEARLSDCDLAMSSLESEVKAGLYVIAYLEHRLQKHGGI